LKEFLRKPIVPVSTLIALLLVSFVLYTTCSFAEAKHPDKGSVQFGATERPKINTPPQFEVFKTVFADIGEKVVPTVVSVIPTKIDTVVFSNNPFYQFFDDPFGNPFEEFFGQPRNRRPPPVEKREYRQQGLGSGVIVSNDGYILTNFHVVAGADEIEVKTSDGRTFEAGVVGVDSLSDVAVIKIKEKVKDLPVAYLGDSDKLRPGDWAIAVGNPFSLTSSVTMGIISALGRQTPGMDNSKYQNYIQTDAAINPGNSGGALVNINGELIGINTLIYTQSGGYMGIGFAIPINMARRIMEDLIYEGKVSRGFLGVSIQDLDPTTREAFGLGSEVKGVLIGDVFKGQPADKAGIKRGDIIVSVNGKAMNEANDLKNYIATFHPGAKVPVEVLRGGKKMNFQIKLTTRDGNMQEQSSLDNNQDNDKSSADVAQKLGIKVGELTPELKKSLGVKGVLVLNVEESSQAAQEGIRRDDIILEVNRQPVESVKDFKQITKSFKTGESVLFLLQRGENTFFKAFKIRK